MDYGNRVGFWRMLDVLNKHKVRACCCLNLELLDHFPEIKNAMVAADWDYMAHGLYNSRRIYDHSEEQEPAYWQDFVLHLKEMTGKRLKGRLGTAEELADVIVFIASPRARWVNGRNIPVDGLEQPHAPLDRRPF